MAEEKNEAGSITPQKRQPVSDAELVLSYEGASLHTNRFFASVVAAGLRLAFMEQYGQKVPPQFRTAVLMSVPDAIALRDMLNRVLKDLEPQVKTQEDAADAARQGRPTVRRMDTPDV